MNRKSNEMTHELVLTEYEKLTIIAHKETQEAVKYLRNLANKARKKTGKDEKINK